MNENNILLLIDAINKIRVVCNAACLLAISLCIFVMVYSNFNKDFDETINISKFNNYAKILSIGAIIVNASYFFLVYGMHR